MARDFRHRPQRAAAGEAAVWLYGIHPVAAALANPRRTVRRLLVTRNAAQRLAEEGIALPAAAAETTPRELDRLVGAEAVHQGVAAEVAPLPPVALQDVAAARLLVVLDQVTDPHNVGAILRSAAALGAGGLVTTGRHAPHETGVLAKAASGALEHVPIVEAGNLAQALRTLGDLGFFRIGLDSEGDGPLESVLGAERVALVLGAEGKGLRRLTRQTCDAVARLDMPGPIKSLNVSNAAALALYLAHRSLGGR
jgi:23S rRNA (guanosine2251-2'-O)-methyltransferase